MDNAPLFKALVAFQQSVTNIQRDQTAKVQTAKASYTYSYTDIAGVIEAVKQPLAENGLCYVQLLDNIDGQPALTTVLAHADGGSISSTVPMRSTDMQDPQKFGGLVTYYRRYALLAILGLATEDDDANHARTPSDTASRGATRSQAAAHHDQQTQQRESPQTPPANAPGAAQGADEDILTWTAFWAYARPLGYNNRNDVEAFLTRSIDNMTPNEVKEAIRVERGEASLATSPRPGYQMTEKQWKTLHEVSRKKKGMDQGQLIAWAAQFNPDKLLSELTVQEASEVIGELYNLPDNPNAVAVLDASGGGAGR